MASVEQLAPGRAETVDAAPGGAPMRRGRPWMRGGLAVAAAAGAAFVLAECRVGPGPRRNQHPIGAHLVNGAPRAQRAFLGLGNFPELLTYVSVALTVVVVVAVVRRSLREGRWTPTLTLIVATTALTAVDPIMNWAPYVVYNPQQLHLPETWVWASISPSIEPVAVFVVYWWFFLAPAWITLLLYRRLAARSSSTSLMNRRPLVSILALGYIVCAIFDAVVEITVIRFGNYTYNQVIGSLSYRAGTTWQFPWYEPVLFGAVMAPTAALMWRDRRGDSWCERRAAGSKRLSRLPNLGAAIVALLILGPAYLVYGGIFTTIRVTHAATTLAKPYNYQDLKVYDPQGDWRRSGQPGPYYRGIWSDWERSRSAPR